MGLLDFEGTQIEGKSLRHTAKPMTFGGFLEGNKLKHSKTIEGIRKSRDKNEIDKLKGTLPAFQFCTTSGGGESSITRKSNIMQIDIDAKDNIHIVDLKEIIKEIPFVSFAMYSASGKGVFLLVEITNPNEYKLHFSAFQKYIEAKYQINIDGAVSNPASLRFWSIDPEPYINESAIKWRYVDTPPKPQKKRFKPSICGGGNIDPFQDFNDRGDVLGLLDSFGYSYAHTKGDKIRLTRPGKNSGVSVDWHTGKRTLYVFSDAPETGLQKPIGYSPASVFIQLAASGDNKEAYRLLTSLGYGKPERTENTTHIAVKPLKYQTFSQDGETWQIEINEYGYPASWDN